MSSLKDGTTPVREGLSGWSTSVLVPVRGASVAVAAGGLVGALSVGVDHFLGDVAYVAEG